MECIDLINCVSHASISISSFTELSDTQIFHVSIVKYSLIFLKTQYLEIVARWCSVKNVFLKILQNLQENTCVGVFFSGCRQI